MILTIGDLVCLSSIHLTSEMRSVASAKHQNHLLRGEKKRIGGQIKLMEELAKKLTERDYMEAPDRKASKLTSRVNPFN